MAAAIDHSITHLVGYTRSQKARALAQRRALLCSLERLADEPDQDAGEDEPGVLNAAKAVQGYVSGGKDPWFIIKHFAF
jgi:hypothetical protein